MKKHYSRFMIEDYKVNTSVGFVSWWDSVKNEEGEDGFVEFCRNINPKLAYPVFQLYADHCRIDNEWPQLWSALRMLSRENMRLSRALCKGYPVQQSTLYETFVLCFMVMWGGFRDHKRTGHRLEYARNVSTLRDSHYFRYVRFSLLRWELIYLNVKLVCRSIIDRITDRINH